MTFNIAVKICFVDAAATDGQRDVWPRRRRVVVVVDDVEGRYVAVVVVVVAAVRFALQVQLVDLEADGIDVSDVNLNYCVDPSLIEFRIVRIIIRSSMLLFLEDIDRIRPIRRLLSDCPKKYFLTKSYIT